MLSVSEGEVVDVLDHSRNDWCLVRPATRPHSEGWVPAAYLTPYREISRVRSPTAHHYSLSTSDESDVSTETSGGQSSPSPMVLSPDILEVYDNEENRAEAEERRRCDLTYRKGCGHRVGGCGQTQYWLLCYCVFVDLQVCAVGALQD